MSCYIYMDVKNPSDGNIINGITKYDNFGSPSAEVWRWNCRDGIDNLINALVGGYPGIDDPNGGTKLFKIHEFSKWVKIYEEIIKHVPAVERLIEIYSVDEDKASDYWYKNLGGYDPNTGYNFEKYDDLTNPKIAKALRTAEIEYNRKLTEEAEEKRINFLLTVKKLCADYCVGNEVYESIVDSMEEFMAFITFTDTIRVIQNTLLDDNYEVRISIG